MNGLNIMAPVKRFAEYMLLVYLKTLVHGAFSTAVVPSLAFMFRLVGFRVPVSA